ncbi:MAG: acyl-CoA thioesterase II [Alphaproteobacteria bacterium]|nr:acyl-CoA thioesterase II [Alphaproteobacteria bacterium]
MSDPAPMTPSDDSVADLLALLDLERIEVNLFRGVSPDDGMKRVFGGQVIAQALVAAYRTVEGRVCHSLHAYFIRPGDPTIPILYEVDRSRDGKSFATRRVVAIQHGEQIFNFSASFQTPETGFVHQSAMPAVKNPDELMSEDQLRSIARDHIPPEFAKHFSRPRPIELKPIDPRAMVSPEPSAPVKQMWLRARGKVGENQPLQQCLLAYASDMGILDTATKPHGVNWFTGGVQMASLDHAMWFHEPFNIEDWLLYSMDSPSASGARGFNRGEVYSRNGVLVASVVQEGLIRRRDPKLKN